MTKNDEKLLDHDYDGIQELDNPLPRWWVIMFYLCILFSVVYVCFYWIGSGLSIEEDFQAKRQKQEQKNKPDSGVSLAINDVKATASVIAQGKQIYAQKCSSCHKADGGGMIGPNLTDDYWINGNGSRSAILKTVKDGVPEKGMISWGPLLSADDLNAVVIYVETLKGSHPKNAKGPEGQKAK
jgi:cytochrome c oxidase cbb3-type subunit III